MMGSDFHIGRLIERVLKEKGISKKWLGDELEYGKNWSGELVKKDSISTAMLMRIGEAVGYNFFEELAQRFDYLIAGTGNQDTAQITAQLSLTEGASLIDAVQHLETHFLPNKKDETQSSLPVVLTRFSVLLGDMASDSSGRGTDDPVQPKVD